MRPVIGLSTYRESATWGHWEAIPADLLPATYAQSISAAGGMPVLLPATTPYDESAEAAVAKLDALVISGGADVSPERYGAEPHDRTTGWRDERDAWELALLDAAAARDIPVLGICRGMQLMAVHAGGELDQHVPDLVGHERHSPPGEEDYSDIPVRVDSGSRLGAMVAPELVVRCHHHQSVRSHPGFKGVAWADDGLLEAMESSDDRWRVAVQWHPEQAADEGLFRALVAAASRD